MRFLELSNFECLPGKAGGSPGCTSGGEKGVGSNDFRRHQFLSILARGRLYAELRIARLPNKAHMNRPVSEHRGEHR